MTQQSKPNAIAAPGVWRVVAYQSGTINVEDNRRQAFAYGSRSVGPHVRIMYGRALTGLTDSEKDCMRYKLAERLAEILNGDSDARMGLERTGEITAIDQLGIEFCIDGPCVDIAPPSCHWVMDMGDRAITARARLMDRIFGIR